MLSNKKKKVDFTSTVLFLLLVIGTILLLYPSAADWWNRRLFASEISDYSEYVSVAEESEISDIINDAIEYNKMRALIGNNFNPLEPEEYAEYNRQLSIDGKEMGIMGVLYIPIIDVELPIYHTANESVLSAGVGHIEGTSLPIGGPSSHSVLSSHRGLTSARLFTDLDKIVEGDRFIIQSFGETITYLVDDIKIVLPEELSPLQIVTGQDYCTLVTCTPYGINSHRLLVRGHRVANDDKDVIIDADARRIDPKMSAIGIGIPILILAYMGIFFFDFRKKR